MLYVPRDTGSSVPVSGLSAVRLLWAERGFACSRNHTIVCAPLQVDDVIKTYKNENITCTKLRNAAVHNIVRLHLLTCVLRSLTP